MILQALADYYQRSGTEKNTPLAPFGFEWREMPFIVCLSESGEFIDLEDTRSPNRNRLIAKPYLVPKARTRSGIKSFEKPNVFWDHYGFIFAQPRQEKEGVSPSDKDIETAQKQQKHFLAQIQHLQNLFPENMEISSVSRFLSEADFSAVFKLSQWEECTKIKGCNLSFRIRNRDRLVCQHPDIIKYLQEEYQEDISEKVGVCLASGDLAPISRLHPEISGVGKKPAPLCASNDKSLPAFSSFGKHQAYNFPVSSRSAFAYTTALNHLLRRGSPQRLQVGDASCVFWADRDHPFVDDFGGFFGEPQKGEDPDRNTIKVRSLLKAVDTGGYCPDDDKARFFLLGLAPNAARISVRFWEQGTVAEIAPRIARHFRDIELVTAHPKDQPHPSSFRLLVNLATQGKADNIPPNLGGELMRAILAGSPYPTTLWQAAVRRNRAEQNVNYYRAALLKGCLNRLQRRQAFMEKEITVSLDTSNPNTGYRLGRLFATLERIQEEAQGKGLNATIRDRFYGAASANPLSVFSNLMKLKNHHLSKMQNPGRVTNMEKLIGEILGEVAEFPAQLPLRDQGLFAIGYYHQRQDFFTKKNADKE